MYPGNASRGRGRVGMATHTHRHETGAAGFKRDWPSILIHITT